jgi:methionine sulfoxide reductase heme-binding subunit
MLSSTILAQIARVSTPAQLDALVSKTYVLTAVSALVALTIAAVLAQSVAYQSGAAPKDPRMRRIIFWSVAVTLPILFFGYNALFVADGVRASLQSRFSGSYAMATGLGVLCYLVGGFVVSRAFSTGKLGNWFPRGH